MFPPPGPIPCWFIIGGLSSNGLLAKTVSLGPIGGGPMSGLGIGVAVFWLVRRFFFGLPPDWDPVGTLKLPILLDIVKFSTFKGDLENKLRKHFKKQQQ
jgi:hypothetical protein